MWSSTKKAAFDEALSAAIAASDSNWRGVAFPPDVKLPDKISFPINGWANVNLQLAPLTSVATLTGRLSVNDHIPTPFPRIRGTVRHVISFTKTSALSLKKRLTKLWKTLGQTIRHIQRRFSTEDPNTEAFRVFEAGGQLINATFLKPDQVLFSEIDLSGVQFRGTNLRGMRFLGVNWWQSSLRRNGLHDEVVVHSSKDGAFRHRQLPILEETCRNARVALEENKSFGAASDFYIGEMEALREQLGFFQRHLFSVAALYRLVSNYGTSVATSLRILLYLYLLHLGLSLMTSASPPRPDFAGEALQSLKLLALQIPPAEAKHGLVRAWIDAVFRVLAPIQIAMVVLAFRSRIKRH